jgi:hypothetical protein
VILRDPEQPLPDVRGPTTRSAQIGGPDGIAQLFQLMAYSGEPVPSSTRANLLANKCWRTALGDEPTKSGP